MRDNGILNFVAWSWAWEYFNGADSMDSFQEPDQTRLLVDPGDNTGLVFAGGVSIYLPDYFCTKFYDISKPSVRMRHYGICRPIFNLSREEQPGYLIIAELLIENSIDKNTWF